MKKTDTGKALLCILLTLLFCLSLTGCRPGNRFVGKWRSEATQANGYKQNVLEFRRDGTASLNGEEVEYVIQGNDKILRINKGFYYSEIKYEFNGSKKLTLTASDAYYNLTGDYEKTKK